MWPTSWTVRAEFLSSVFTLITPWLSPPMDNMALAGSGAPRTPGLQRQQKRKWRNQTGSEEILHRLHVSMFSSFTTTTGKSWWKSWSGYIYLKLGNLLKYNARNKTGSCPNQKSLCLSLFCFCLCTSSLLQVRWSVLSRPTLKCHPAHLIWIT